MLRQSFAIAAFASGILGLAGPTFASDAAAGKTVFDQTCSSCHEVGEFKGKSAAELTSTVQDIVAGKAKHKKALKLTDVQVSDVAAFISSSK